MTDILWPFTILAIAGMVYHAYVRTITKREISDIEEIKKKIQDIDERVRQVAVGQTLGSRF